MVTGADPVGWREQAMSRVLTPAQRKAATRIQSFFDAAVDLMQASGTDFTVQELVERSGQSLRSFYQYFDGKHSVLLAVFEDAVATTASELRSEIAGEEDALERLHRFVTGYYRRCRPAPRRRPGGRSSRAAVLPRAFAEFSQQLLTQHPEEAARAFNPLIDLLVELLDAASEAGYLRAGLRHERVAGVVLQALMFDVFAATIAPSSGGGRRADPAEELWEILLRGIGAR